MECPDKSAVPVRKLIQARLPFKRLNPVPKEKPEATPGAKKPRSSPVIPDQNTPCSGLSHPLLDNVENSGQEEREAPWPSTLVNGKGPLDSFVQKRTRGGTHPSWHGRDLSAEAGHKPAEEGDPGTPESVAVAAAKKPAEVEIPRGSPETGCDHPRECAQFEICPVGPVKEERPPVPPSATDSNLVGVLFEKKRPVVVLEDIMASRSPQASLSERSGASRKEADGPCPTEDPACTDSSFSSLSLTSSPELGSAQEGKEDAGPFDASTPARKTSQKIQRSSEEKEKLKLQRQAEREEKERAKEEARVAKERAREEAKRRREEEKELKEKERREKKEKEEKEKAEKLRAKEEKRKERQEALEAKLEEKRKKEEEKRLKEEEKRIKAEKAEITRFFQKPKTPPAPKTLAGWCGKFAPFEIKENMVLAPSCRVAIEPEALDQLDSLLQAQSGASNFLEELKSRGPCRSGPTLARSRRDDDANSDVVIVGSSQAGDVPERDSFGRMKLLQFCENHRPAYWGTWNKKTSAIRPRNPWSKDEKLLDYEVESDEEWEEEEPGESLSHSEGDDDEDGGEEEEEDDGFFVPHGYLSEDEGVTEECDPENQKVRQKLKDKEWDELMAKGKRFRVLQPVKVGCVWEGEEEEEEDGGGADRKLLQPFAVALLESSAADEEQAEKSSQKKTKNQQILGQLLPLLHGNVNGSRVIIQEFQACCRLGLLPLGQEGNPSRGEGGGGGGGDGPGAASSSSQPQTPLLSEENAVPSKARLKRLISENSVYTKRPDHRMCWYVHPEVLKSYGQESLPVPCQWNYVTQVPSVAAREEGGSGGIGGGHSPGGGGGGAAAPTTPAAAPAAGKRKLTGSMSITKFMKRTPETGQTPETDGFQADTEEDEEEDCILMEAESSPAPVDARTPTGKVEGTEQSPPVPGDKPSGPV